MSTNEIRIEPLTQHEQFDRCVAIQHAVWRYDVSAMMTQKVFLLASTIGGQVLGAYDGDTMVGYAMSLPGVRREHAYLHSHHLAVLPEWRSEGIGRRLKLAQREDGLLRGFELMEWTFDPLEIVNGYLNISKLGAICRRYKRDFYGPSSSPLQGGLPTDRIYAEWWLRSDRVRRALAGQKPVGYPTESVIVPAQVSGWKAVEETRERALGVQKSNADVLQSAFERGLAVIGYERTDEGDGLFLLGEWNEGLEY